ncbi:MAG: tRNA 2-selenouridine(34) synthase MnmH [Microcoleaceae cyanobacterium]
MAQSLHPDEFLKTLGIILDVRSPGEYTQGHIPEAINFPLLSNEERAKVGICYKQQGRENAVELGFEIVGPKCANFITQAKQLAPDKTVRIYCWRGGMRSESVGWLLEKAGFNVTLLIGGYKGFRRWGKSLFKVPQNMIILAGKTGTGKTDILTALAKKGEQVLDLEKLANHRGSSYGSLGQPPQPTNEQFCNLMIIHWAKLDRQKSVWIEAESKRIGICRIPQDIVEQMNDSPIVEIILSPQERVESLVKIYGNATIEELIIATKRIKKRLGGVRAKQAIELIQQQDLASACQIILEYYDRTYTYHLEKQNVPIHTIDLSGLSTNESVAVILQMTSALNLSSSCN